MTGGVRWRWWRLRLSQAVQAEQHRHHQARGAHGPCHPAERERGERGRVAEGTRAVPGHGKPGSGRRSGRRAATQPLQKFPRSYLGAGRGREHSAPRAGRGWMRRGGAGLGGTGQGGARPTARPRGGGEPEGVCRRAEGTNGAPRCWDQWGRRETKTPSACDGSWQPGPAICSPPFYTGRSGTTTAEGLQARAC